MILPMRSMNRGPSRFVGGAGGTPIDYKREDFTLKTPRRRDLYRHRQSQIES
jgi:hypothetical protein